MGCKGLQWVAVGCCVPPPRRPQHCGSIAASMTGGKQDNGLRRIGQHYLQADPLLLGVCAQESLTAMLRGESGRRLRPVRLGLPLQPLLNSSYPVHAGQQVPQNGAGGFPCHSPSPSQLVSASQLVLSVQLSERLRAGESMACTYELPPASLLCRRPPTKARAWCRSF